MSNHEIVTALQKLGFNDGWVVCDGQIVLWEHDQPQPTNKELQDAIK